MNISWLASKNVFGKKFKDTHFFRQTQIIIILRDKKGTQKGACVQVIYIHFIDTFMVH